MGPRFFPFALSLFVLLKETLLATLCKKRPIFAQSHNSHFAAFTPLNYDKWRAHWQIRTCSIAIFTFLGVLRKCVSLLATRYQHECPPLLARQYADFFACLFMWMFVLSSIPAEALPPRVGGLTRSRLCRTGEMLADLGRTLRPRLAAPSADTRPAAAPVRRLIRLAAGLLPFT